MNSILFLICVVFPHKGLKMKTTFSVIYKWSKWKINSSIVLCHGMSLHVNQILVLIYVTLNLILPSFVEPLISLLSAKNKMFRDKRLFIDLRIIRFDGLDYLMLFSYVPHDVASWWNINNMMPWISNSKSFAIVNYQLTLET